MSFSVAKFPSSSRRTARSTSGLGELEEPAGLAFYRDGDARPCALRFNRLLDVERHWAGGDLKGESPRWLKRLDPHCRFHTPAEELAYLLAAGTRLHGPLDTGLERARLPLRRVRRIGCVREDLFRRAVDDN